MGHTREKRRGDWLRGVVLVLVVAGGAPTAQGFRQDEVECEDAVAYLASCCSGFPEHDVQCDYVAGCDTNEYPSLTPSESECILDRSCSELADGICKRVLARQTATDATNGAPSPAVCP
jgi:hypothetical protein